MPTPSDSTTSLPLERERSTHATCPPEDDRSGQWRVEVLDRLGRTATSDTFDSTTTRQQEDQSPEAGSPGPLENSSDGLEDDTSGHTTERTALLEPAEASPRLDRESLTNFPMDDKEVESVLTTAPGASALDLPYSIRYGIGSARVCHPLLVSSTNSVLMENLVNSDAHLFDASCWEQISGYTAVG